MKTGRETSETPSAECATPAHKGVWPTAPKRRVGPKPTVSSAQPRADTDWQRGGKEERDVGGGGRRGGGEGRVEEWERGEEAGEHRKKRRESPTTATPTP